MIRRQERFVRYVQLRMVDDLTAGQPETLVYGNKIFKKFPTCIRLALEQ
jgi:hypothetical protein